MSNPLLTVLDYSHGSTADGAFSPSLDSNGQPVLAEGEAVVWSGTGALQQGFAPWEGAPTEDVVQTPDWSEVLVSQHRIIVLCRQFAFADGVKDHRSGRNPLMTTYWVGFAATAVSASKAKGKAKKAMRGRVLAGQIPFEAIQWITLSPESPLEGLSGTLDLGLYNGDEIHLAVLGIRGPSLVELRGLAQWLVQKVVEHRRWHAVHVQGLDNELAAEVIGPCDRPEINGGELTWPLPLAVDMKDCSARR